MGWLQRSSRWLAGLRCRQSLQKVAQLQLCLRTVVKSRLLMISVSRPANGDGQVQQAGQGEEWPEDVTKRGR